MLNLGHIHASLIHVSLFQGGEIEGFHCIYTGMSYRVLEYTVPCIYGAKSAESVWFQRVPCIILLFKILDKQYFFISTLILDQRRLAVSVDRESIVHYCGCHGIYGESCDYPHYY